MNGKKRVLSYIAVLAACLAMAVGFFVSCAPVDALPPGVPETGAPTLTIDEDGGDIHTLRQRYYLDSPYYELPDGVNGNTEQSAPAGVTVSWTPVIPAKPTYKPATQRLEISDDPDFTDVTSYVLPVASTHFTFKNLFVQRRYYWRISLVDETGTARDSAVSSFVTGCAPRNMSVGGVINFRDMGGYIRSDGTLVKQGMLFRCAELNAAWVDNVTPTVTVDGKEYLCDTIGVKTEIDLRGGEGIGEIGGLTDKSVLGDSVTYKYIGMPYDFSIASKQHVREVFRVLADPDSYPVIFHCHIGTDRTGLVAFLVNALMGVDEESLYRDYMFSNFAGIGGGRDTQALDGHINGICCYPGETLADKAEAYLIDCGLTADNVASIRAILSCDDTPVTVPGDSVHRTALGAGDIDLDAICGIVAWTRYGSGGVVRMPGGESILPAAGDTAATLTDKSDNFSFRNNDSSVDARIAINGIYGALLIGSRAKAEDLGYGIRAREDAVIPVNVDANTDKVIFYCGIHTGRTDITLCDSSGDGVRAMGRTSDRTVKNVYRYVFDINVSSPTALTLRIKATTAYSVYIAAVAVTSKT